MASVAKPPNATSAERLAGGQKAAHPDPDDNDTSISPYIWIMLAEDALNAGRRDQAEELIGEAYLAYDEATEEVATSASGSDEEEPEFDFQPVSEVNQMGGYNRLLSTLISGDSSGMCANRHRKVFMRERLSEKQDGSAGVRVRCTTAT